MWEIEQSRRMRTLGYIVLGVITLLLLRLAWMQILQGPQYKKVAESNRVRQTIIQAPRGSFYDRNGAVVVANRPSFAVSIMPSEYTNPQNVTPVLSSIIGVPVNEIEDMLKKAEDSPYTPVRIKRDVDTGTIARIEERKDSLPGVIIEAIPVRQYVYKQLAAHVFGYLGRINEEEYAERKNQGYRSSDLIGKDGLEREWEGYLRGIDGGHQVEVNAQGEEVRLIGDRTAVPGKSIVLTLDANLQKVAEDGLAFQIENAKQVGEPAKGGAIVVLDVKTGGVLVWASAPTYDPNVFAGGISSRDWNAIVSNPNHPLTNRVFQSAFPPGSVFKIVNAAAALDSGATTTSEIFDDRGVYILNGWSFYGWEPKGLGKLNISDALAWSSDPVFYELARRMGANKLAAYALTFGLGQKTGVKLAGEEKGTVPTEEWKMATYGEPWYPGETVIAGIGQGYYQVTPLQQALLLMAVANGGIVYKPQLVDKVLNLDGSVLESYPPEVLRTIYLKPEYWQAIRQGLSQVPTKGTAAAVFQGFPKTLAGKTGSAETGTGTTHSWFACYSPADNPEIVVAAFVEDGGEGSVSAAPLVRRVLEAYYGLPSPPVEPAALPKASD